MCLQHNTPKRNCWLHNPGGQTKKKHHQDTAGTVCSALDLETIRDVIDLVFIHPVHHLWLGVVTVCTEHQDGILLRVTKAVLALRVRMAVLHSPYLSPARREAIETEVLGREDRTAQYQLARNNLTKIAILYVLFEKNFAWINEGLVRNE